MDFFSNCGVNKVDTLTGAGLPHAHHPFTIIRTGDRTSEIIIPIPGYRPDEVEVLDHGNFLTVIAGAASQVHKHINGFTAAYREWKSHPFGLRFNLEHNVQVDDVSFLNGVLTISLLLAEAEPKRIDIRTGDTAPKQAQKSAPSDAPVPPASHDVPPKSDAPDEGIDLRSLIDFTRNAIEKAGDKDLEGILKNIRTRFPKIDIREIRFP